MFFCCSTLWGDKANVQQKMQTNRKYFREKAQAFRDEKWVEAKPLIPVNIWQIIKKSS
jgi:hypothetical protein